MLGLIKKDLFLLKSNLVYFLVIALVYSFMIVGGSFDGSFIMILPFIAVVMFLSTFSYDGFNKWDSYAITLPVDRKEIVMGKYISAIIIIILSSIIGLFIYCLISLLPNQIYDIEYVLEEYIGAIFSIIIVISIMFPLIFKFGIEKARILLFVCVFGFIIILELISNYVDFDNLFEVVNILDKWWFIVIPLIAILFLLISYFISYRIYSKKEF